MLHHAILLREALGKGKGLFAQRFIAQGELIWSDIDLKETELEFTASELIGLPEHMRIHAYWNGNCYVWHQDDPGNYMNHSCNPNVWHIQGNVMVARHDILPMEELTYDYSTCEIWPSNQIIISVCLCRSDNCRSVITTSDLFLHPTLANIHNGHLPEYAAEAVRRHFVAIESTSVG